MNSFSSSVSAASTLLVFLLTSGEQLGRALHENELRCDSLEVSLLEPGDEVEWSLLVRGSDFHRDSGVEGGGRAVDFVENLDELTVFSVWMLTLAGAEISLEAVDTSGVLAALCDLLDGDGK